MAALSIGKAWDDTVRLVRREAALLAPVALALIALPFIVVGQVVPAEAMQVSAKGGPAALNLPPSAIVGLVVAGLFSLTGSLAIYVLALQPGISVGEALQRALRRLPILLLTMLLLAAAIGMVVVLLSVVGGLVSLAVGQGAAVSLSVAMIGAVVLLASGRLLLLNVIVVDTELGPLDALRESWHLARGATGRLIAFVLIFAVLILLFQAIGQSVFGLLGGLIGGKDLGRLLGDLAGGAATAAIQLYFLVMTANIYNQLRAARS